MIRTMFAGLFTLALVVIASFALGDIAAKLAAPEYAEFTRNITAFTCVIAGGMAWGEILDAFRPRRKDAVAVKNETASRKESPGS